MKLCVQSCQEVKPNQGQLPRWIADSRLFCVQRKNRTCLICALQYIYRIASGRAAQPRQASESQFHRVDPPKRCGGEHTMMKNFEDMQKMSKDSMDATMKSFGTLSKTSQAIAAEVADYSKKSFEEGTKVVEKLFGAKSLDKAMEIQAD